MWFGFVAGVMNLGLVSLATQASSMHDQRPMHLAIVLVVQVGILGALRAVRAQPRAPGGTVPTENSGDPPLGGD